MNRTDVVSSTKYRKCQKILRSRTARKGAASIDARRTAIARRSHARAQLLFLGVTLERERDQAIEQSGIRKAACCPHLRVHADRREPGDGVHFVEVQHLAVARKQEVDARHP